MCNGDLFKWDFGKKLNFGVEFCLQWEYCEIKIKQQIFLRFFTTLIWGENIYFVLNAQCSSTGTSEKICLKKFFCRKLKFFSLPPPFSPFLGCEKKLEKMGSCAFYDFTLEFEGNLCVWLHWSPPPPLTHLPLRWRKAALSKKLKIRVVLLLIALNWNFPIYYRFRGVGGEEDWIWLVNWWNV